MDKKYGYKARFDSYKHETSKKGCQCLCCAIKKSKNNLAVNKYRQKQKEKKCSEKTNKKNT